MNLDKALQTFLEESRELLTAMEEALLTLESAPTDADAINAVFRAMHTIKGSAGIFGLDPIVSFTHVAESLMDRVRDGELPVNDRLIALLFGCQDHIAGLLDEVASHADRPDPNRVEAGATLLNSLRAYLDPRANPQAPAATAHPDATPHGQPWIPVGDGGEGVANDAWHVSVRFDRELLRNGFDPLSFVRYLGNIGQIPRLEVVSDALPPAEHMDPEACYLGFEFRLAGDLDQGTIESAFEFIQADCSLTVLPPHAPISAYVQLIQGRPEDRARLGGILVACGSLTEAELAEVARIQAAPTADEASGPAGVDAPPVPTGTGEPTALPPTREAKPRESRVIRVDAAKLDDLINLVGELVIAGSAAEVLARRDRHRGLVEANATIVQLVGAIRDSALRLRMVEIGETFNRFRRVVRDVAQELGKEVELVITGAETELDKSVVEKIGDPLMHLVRNALDHGLESSERRSRAGKPVVGRLQLNAYHESGSIVIEIVDDGAGLNRERILAKARDRGLVAPGHVPSDHEIDQLIFEPGFSTADQVTNLSGRGVGMDVVRRNIDALRGSIHLDSQPGAGTRVSIRLPLTLAIIDGFLVGVGEGAYVIPLDCVVECIRFDPAGSTSQDYLNLRGQVLPFLRLRELFRSAGKPPRRQNIVVIQYAGQRVGLVVDQLLGECQTVIKPLGRLLNHLRGFFAGSTILGSGEVAMILDIQELIRVAILRDGASHERNANAALSV